MTEQGPTVARVVSAATQDFTTFYRDHHRPVVRLAYVLSGRWSLAEEVTQEAFVRAMDRWGSGELRDPAAWVRTVAVNLARSRLRRVGAEVRALARLDRPTTSPPPSLPPDTLEFFAAVRRLPRRQGEAVALFYLEDLAVTDVAEVMGIAEGTVKALLHQARTRLADDLGTDPT